MRVVGSASTVLVALLFALAPPATAAPSKLQPRPASVVECRPSLPMPDVSRQFATSEPDSAERNPFDAPPSELYFPDERNIASAQRHLSRVLSGEESPEGVELWLVRDRWSSVRTVRIDSLGVVSTAACQQPELFCAPVASSRVTELIAIAAEIQPAPSEIRAGVWVVTPFHSAYLFGEPAAELLASVEALVFEESCGPEGWIPGMQACWRYETEFADRNMPPIVTICRNNCWDAPLGPSERDWEQVPCESP